MWSRAKILLIIFMLTFLVYLFSRPHPLQWYKHYVYLAQAFLEGRADLRDLPGYYHDIVLYKGKAYFPNPPMPAVMLLPFVAIWGTETDEVRVSMLLGSINVALVWVLLGRVGIVGGRRYWFTALFGLGTVHWEVATRGTAWFFAHVVAVFFLLLTLIEFFGRRRWFLVGLFLGLAAAARFPVILGVLFFLPFILKRGRLWKQALPFAMGIVLTLLGQGFYNYIRFGNPLETGYMLQNMYSSVQAPDIARWGFFDLHYIPKHLYIILLKPPDYIDSPPFLRPSPEGMSLLLTTPAVLYAVKAPLRNVVNVVAWAAVVAIMIPSLVYVATGWVQFGYRYSLDFFPFLLLLIAAGMGEKMTPGKIALIVSGIVVNAWGVYWSQRLGW